MSTTSAPVPTNTRNNQQPDRQAAQTLYPPVKSKCEFCDVSFERDIDVGRHLTSQVHIGNRNDFLATHNPRDKVTEKQVPKNFKQVLQTLKLRSVRDLKELTEKGYFDIRDACTADLAQNIAKALVRSTVEFESVNLAPNIRQFLLESLRAPEKQTNVDQACPASSSSSRISSAPKQRPQPVSTRDESSKTHPTVVSGARRTAPPQRPQPTPPPPPPPTRAPRPNLSSSTRTEPTQTSSQTTNREGGVAPPRQPQPPRPTPPQPSSSSTTKHATQDKNPNPVPRKDSNYIPKLAIVKLEPKG